MELCMELVTDYVPTQTKRSTLTGSVERVSYFNKESGQCIFEIKDDVTEEIVFISGKIPWIYPGVSVSADITSVEAENNLHRVRNLTIQLPKAERSLKKFLRSDAFNNLGPKLIKLLVKAFPNNLISVIENTPDHLLFISGIGQKKKNQIVESWYLFSKKVELQTLLFNELLPLNWFHEMWLRYADKSIDLLKRNPYKIASKLHLPFELIDSFALGKGFSFASPERLRFGFIHVLWRAYKQGHCAYPEQKIIRESMQLLDANQGQIEDILELEIVSGHIVTEIIHGETCLYFKEIWDLERKVAGLLLGFQKKEPPWGWFNSYKVINWAQGILKIQLASMQKEAIETALSSSLTVISGGPGTGKTTLIRSLVTILQTQFLKFALCSPTGRATQRLAEATQIPAQTIHRLLKYDSTTGRCIHNRNNPLNLDLVLVDEASMVDLALMADLLDAMPVKAALILVGDSDQIPSVGAGNVLHSILSSPLFRVVRLEEIFRQSEHSSIKENARRINLGQMPFSSIGSDFQYIPVHGIDETKAIVRHLLSHVLPDAYGINGFEDTQILVPLKQGSLGTKVLNEETQKEIFKNFPSSMSVDFGHDFRVGDKAMVIKNDYQKDVFNGDIGFIEKIDFHERFLELNLLGRPIRFDFCELDQLTLAYAISVHKSQGSEYRVAIVVLNEEHSPMLQRHLVYTAVTRGKDYVFLVAEPSALQKALQNVESRWENLTQLLQQSTD
jgi:exodeoxyribonuclease V alpha subunit